MSKTECNVWRARARIFNIHVRSPPSVRPHVVARFAYMAHEQDTMQRLGRSVTRLADALQSRLMTMGWGVVVLRLPRHVRTDVFRGAYEHFIALQARIQLLATEYESITHMTLVGFGYGGLMARWSLQSHGGHKQPKRYNAFMKLDLSMVTICTPHHGIRDSSRLAWFRRHRLVPEFPLSQLIEPMTNIRKTIHYTTAPASVTIDSPVLFLGNPNDATVSFASSTMADTTDKEFEQVTFSKKTIGVVPACPWGIPVTSMDYLYFNLDLTNVLMSFLHGLGPQN